VYFYVAAAHAGERNSLYTKPRNNRRHSGSLYGIIEYTKLHRLAARSGYSSVGGRGGLRGDRIPLSTALSMHFREVSVHACVYVCVLVSLRAVVFVRFGWKVVA
jgi:hypothetical protein